MDNFLKGMVDVVFAEIGLPGDGTHWKAATRRRVMSALGFSIAMAAHAYSLLPAETYPHLTEMIVEHVLKPGYALDRTFLSDPRANMRA